MNANQWLDLISAAAPSFKWITPNGYIRTTDGRCPICAALYWVSDGQIDYHELARVAIGDAGLLVTREVDRIIGSADNKYYPTGPDYRNKLLTAVGLPIFSL